MEILDPKKLRAQAINEWNRCKVDDIYFIYNYCWTIDTRKLENKIFMMKPWPHLLDLIKELNKAVEGGYNVIIEKSRDMGISWTIMAWQLHKTLFTEGWMSLNISRKEAEVEDPGKTPKSLFGRLEFMHSRLPSYLKMRIDNPFLAFKCKSNNSYISGESANVNAGRDMQYSFILIDEAGMIPVLEEMWQSVANSSNCIVLNSTPPRLGKEHKFGQLRFMKTADGKSAFKVLSYHWKQHPEKNAVWFAKKSRNMTEEDIARELDINWEKSVTLKIYHEFDESFHVPPEVIPYNPRLSIYMSFDFGLDDPESILFYQIIRDADKEDMPVVIDEYEKGNLLTHEHFFNIKKILYEMKYKGKIPEIKATGDPEGKKRERTSRVSVVQTYAKLGLNIDIKEAGLEERRRSVKLLLKGKDSLGNPRILISRKCTNLIEALKSHQRKNKDEMEARRTKHTHSATSLEFFCVKYFPALSVSAVVYGKDPEPVRHAPMAMPFSRNRRSLIWNPEIKKIQKKS